MSVISFRFGNRYFQNLNAEEEVPGVSVVLHGAGLWTNLGTLSALVKSRAPSMG